MGNIFPTRTTRVYVKCIGLHKRVFTVRIALNAKIGDLMDAIRAKQENYHHLMHGSSVDLVHKRGVDSPYDINLSFDENEDIPVDIGRSSGDPIFFSEIVPEYVTPERLGVFKLANTEDLAIAIRRASGSSVRTTSSFRE